MQPAANMISLFFRYVRKNPTPKKNRCRKACRKNPLPKKPEKRAWIPSVVSSKSSRGQAAEGKPARGRRHANMSESSPRQGAHGGNPGAQGSGNTGAQRRDNTGPLQLGPRSAARADVMHTGQHGLLLTSRASHIVYAAIPC